MSAAGISAVGDGLADVSLGLLAVSLTTDARLVTGVLVASRVPWLLFGRTIARRVDGDRAPVRWMIGADAGRLIALAAMAALVVAGAATIPLIYLTAFVIGIGEIVHTAAANVILPSVASGDDLPKANGYLNAAQTGGYAMTGPALAGVVYAAGRALPFAADAVTFGLSGALLLPLADVEGRDAPSPATAAPSTQGSPFAVSRRHPLLRILLVQFACLGLTQAMVLSLLPLYGRSWLLLGPGMYGLFLGGNSVGNVLGGVLGPRLWTGRRHTASFILGSGTVAGIAYVVASRVHQPVLACAVLACEAFAVGVMNTIVPTLRMEHAPPALRGQISTLFRQVIFVSMPIGAILSGFLARRYGIEASFSAAGSIVIATMLATDRPLRRAVAAVGA